MQLKLTEYVRIIISPLHKQKMKLRYSKLLTEILNFRLYFTKNIGYFELGDDYDVTVMSYLILTLVCMERGDPQLYYGTNKMYLVVSFSGKTWYKKNLSKNI